MGESLLFERDYPQRRLGRMGRGQVSNYAKK
jgi:hypothetical protein